MAIMRRRIVAGLALLLGVSAASPVLADRAYQYDALGRVIKVTDAASGKTIRYHYDAAGNRTSVIAADANTAPVAVNDTASATAGASATLNPLANDTDADGDTLSITGQNAPTGVTVSWNATAKAMTLSALTSGSWTVTYNISDGNGGTDQGSIALTINDPEGYCEFPAPGSGFWIEC